MMFKCIRESLSVMRSYCETVSFMKLSTTDAFDVFELYEVFRFLIRAFYVLVRSITMEA